MSEEQKKKPDSKAGDFVAIALNLITLVLAPFSVRLAIAVLFLSVVIEVGLNRKEILTNWKRRGTFLFMLAILAIYLAVIYFILYPVTAG
jgi:NADH:ubiquinone oxidoreductase subunit 6 (subunit J)